MKDTELIILVICLGVFILGVSLFLIQKAQMKIKKLKSSNDKKPKEEKSSEKKTKTKHLRPVVLTAKPAQEKEAEEEKTARDYNITSKARNAEDTDEISFEAPVVSKSDIIDIDELKSFVDDRPKMMPRRTINLPQESAPPMQVYDGLPADFVDDVLPGDEIFGKSQPEAPHHHRTGQSEFLSNRGDDKRLYEELKNMSPEMKKIIMADILKRRDRN